jgi:hypothetical protein
MAVGVATVAVARAAEMERSPACPSRPRSNSFNILTRARGSSQVACLDLAPRRRDRNRLVGTAVAGSAVVWRFLFFFAVGAVVAARVVSDGRRERRRTVRSDPRAHAAKVGWVAARLAATHGCGPVSLCKAAVLHQVFKAGDRRRHDTKLDIAT